MAVSMAIVLLSGVRGIAPAKQCDTMWTEPWRNSVRKSIGQLYKRSKSDPNYVFHSRDPCIPDMSNFYCTNKNSYRYCDIIVTPGEGYIGDIKASTTLPTKKSMNGTVCKLQFNTSPRRINVIQRRSWRNWCKPVFYTHWMEWGSWSNCTDSCGSKQRSRKCIEGSITSGNDRLGSCEGIIEQIDELKCDIKDCPYVTLWNNGEKVSVSISKDSPQNDQDCDQYEFTWEDGQTMSQAACRTFAAEIENAKTPKRHTIYARKGNLKSKKEVEIVRPMGKTVSRKDVSLNKKVDQCPTACGELVDELKKTIEDLSARLAKLEI